MRRLSRLITGRRGPAETWARDWRDRDLEFLQSRLIFVSGNQNIQHLSSKLVRWLSLHVRRIHVR